MCDSCGCSTHTEERSSPVRTLFLGLALAAVVSFSGAFGFSSTAALAANDSQVSADTPGNVSTCPCGGGSCCGFCGSPPNKS